MRNTLFIVSLYLILSACGEKSNEVKFTSEGNPVVMDKFTSDPAPWYIMGGFTSTWVTMRLKKDRTLT